MKLVHRRASIKQLRDAARRRGIILLSIIVNELMSRKGIALLRAPLAGYQPAKVSLLQGF